MERKEKRVGFICCWNWNHWDFLPAISLHNYFNAFDIHFNFMGLWVEIEFLKKSGVKESED